ncbi:hypothetical protein [Mycolicibacterium sp. lyk4-40-TYG-92]|nr:hypothetical protein [Mycolicibacterium sp. lyk4-40-TYG-92]
MSSVVRGDQTSAPFEFNELIPQCRLPGVGSDLHQEAEHMFDNTGHM